MDLENNMPHFTQTLLALSVLGLSLGAFACDSKTSAPAATETAANAVAPAITVEELSTKIEKKEVTVCDANSEETRKKHGVIPGAVLMSNYEDMSALPEDKNASLVFYCGSEKCSAAPKAATKALSAGYKDVKVLKVGIKGWVSAGKTTDKKG